MEIAAQTAIMQDKSLDLGEGRRMMRTCNQMTLLFAALALLVAGCGGEEKKEGAPKGKTEAESSQTSYKRYAASDLPAVDKPALIVDDGKLEIAPPVEWVPIPRQKGFLVNFIKESGKVASLPRISVTAGQPPGVAEDTTEDNAAALVSAIQQQLAKDKKKIVREQPKAIVLGGRTWARHVRQANLSGTICAIQSLQIVRDGKLYSIELTSVAKSDSVDDMAAAVTKDRDQAYAVAANVRFTREKGASAPNATDKPAEEKPTDKPAEEKGTEEKPAPEKPAEAKPEGKKSD